MEFSIPFTIEESTKEEEGKKHVDYQSEAQRAKKHLMCDTSIQCSKITHKC